MQAQQNTKPTPLKTILSPSRYPFAVACVKDGKIVSTVAYETTLEAVYKATERWQASIAMFNMDFHYIIAEMREIGEVVPNVSTNTYWVAV